MSWKLAELRWREEVGLHTSRWELSEPSRLSLLVRPADSEGRSRASEPSTKTHLTASILSTRGLGCTYSGRSLAQDQESFSLNFPSGKHNSFSSLKPLLSSSRTCLSSLKAAGSSSSVHNNDSEYCREDSGHILDLNQVSPHRPLDLLDNHWNNHDWTSFPLTHSSYLIGKRSPKQMLPTDTVKHFRSPLNISSERG